MIADSNLKRSRRKSNAKKRKPSHEKSEEQRLKFLQEGEYQGWTNTFSRKTVQWDKAQEILEQEKNKVNHPLPETDRCCGNSPGKSHTNRDHSGSASPTHKRIKSAIVSVKKTLQASPARKMRVKEENQIINISTSSKTATKLKPYREREPIQKKELRMMAQHIANVLSTKKTKDVLTSLVTHEGKRMRLSKFLEMK